MSNKTVQELLKALALCVALLTVHALAAPATEQQPPTPLNETVPTPLNETLPVEQSLTEIGEEVRKNAQTSGNSAYLIYDYAVSNIYSDNIL